MKTKLRDRWDDGKSAVNAWLGIPSGFTAEVTGRQDFDSVTIDLQHGLIDYQMALSMLQAMSGSDATPMARVPWLEPGIIMKMLDAGAMGIICPMVNTRADAEKLVGACRYAPQGYRSSGPTRAIVAYGPRYHADANTSITILAMIETVEAVKNVKEIAATPGLTGLYIGPSDLAVSMGKAPGLDQTDPEVMANIEKTLKAAKAAGIKACIHCLEPAYAKRMIGLGFDLVTVGSDVRLYAAALAGVVKEMRG